MAAAGPIDIGEGDGQRNGGGHGPESEGPNLRASGGDHGAAQPKTAPLAGAPATYATGSYGDAGQQNPPLTYKDGMPGLHRAGDEGNDQEAGVPHKITSQKQRDMKATVNERSATIPLPVGPPHSTLMDLGDADKEVPIVYKERVMAPLVRHEPLVYRKQAGEVPKVIMNGAATLAPSDTGKHLGWMSEATGAGVPSMGLGTPSEMMPLGKASDRTEAKTPRRSGRARRPPAAVDADFQLPELRDAEAVDNRGN
ncbi:hypothetical protein OG21DRAFT_1489910 [Imleria badia]|nr:hypothetical protein OG21DRAFT_1489910 [Imleria badia]